MSSEALPITARRFAEALTDLPVSSLHAKISELQNSIAHLQKSNKELEDFIRSSNDDEGNRECFEAVMENRQVIIRMNERIKLVRREIAEVRGLPLGESAKSGGQPVVDATATTNGQPSQQAAEAAANGHDRAAAPQNTNGEQQDEDGVFL